MANKQKVGSRGKVFKKRKNVGISRISLLQPSRNSQPSSSSQPSSNSPQPSTSSTPQVQAANKPQKISSSKLKMDKNILSYDERNESLEYDIINFEQFVNTLKDIAVCKTCGHQLSFKKTPVVGLVNKLKVICSNCNNGKEFYNCDSVEVKDEKGETNNTYYDLNLRLVYGLRSLGKGHTGAQLLCGILNLPPPPTHYSDHEHFLASILEGVCKNSMESAVEEAVTMNDGSRDLLVAVDGSWQKRGHTSLNGVVTVTCVDSGKVLDAGIYSKFCRCPGRSNNEHSDDCSANYLGTSGGMEVQGAVDIFTRSVPQYNVRFTHYLGDGDSRGFTAVSESQPYGPGVTIEKVECVGHVQKRMGTRLRKLKASKKKLSDGKSLSGKNRLTDVAIQTLQTFYGLAIRRNVDSVAKMKQAVWAEYFHVGSSNENPTHNLCPKGAETWCKYNRSVLLNEEYDHAQHFHLPKIIMAEIKPIFRDLANVELLKKCLRGKSQNPNESVNNVIWTRVPKRTFVALPTLKFGIYDAISCFNEGHIIKCKLMEHMGFSSGKHLVTAMKKLDVKRVYQSEKAISDLEKKVRQSRTLANKRLEDMYANAGSPDNPDYEAGAY
jgi:hypothetical protein